MKKGFTLIELLAIIVILGIIMAIVVPAVQRSIDNSKNRIYDVTVNDIIKGARDYVVKYGTEITSLKNTGIGYISIGQMKARSVLESSVINPKTEEEFSNTSVVKATKYADGHYEFEFLIDGIPNDPNPPIITLLGSTTVSVTQGSSYSDAGATAYDAEDGDITSSITIVSTVNTSTIGTYTVTYNVSDASGNNATAVVRTVNVVTLPDYIASEGVNRPRLSTGLTAVKWNGSNWVTVTNPDTDTSWYDYANKQWANAKTADGSMWVWIPRYVYRIPTANWHTSTAGTIDVQFSMGTDDTRGGTVTLNTATTSNASNNTWTNHPGFTFGTTELTGLWVAKFEASSTDPSAYEGGGNVTTLKVKSLPGIITWRSISVGTTFTVTRAMETDNYYGWGTGGSGLDTHLMKNVEWGATTYLAHSVYGKNDEIWGNNSGTTDYTGYISGCDGDSVNETPYGGCKNSYETTNGVKASTTGNIYGIYDMSGGAAEIVAAYVDNGVSWLATNGSNIVSAASKYKDVYEVGATDTQANNYALTINKKGDAIYETSSNISGLNSWYADYAYMSNTDTPWFIRGYYAYNGQYCGGTFAFYFYQGGSYTNYGFRPVLLIASGL